MKTDAQYLAWLKSSAALRCVLIEVGVRSGESEITRYLSNAGYTSGPTDSPANTYYRSVIAGGVTLTESLMIDAGGVLNAGDIELHNQDGSLDAWFNDVWVNRPIKVFSGDKRWPRADFRLVFDGVVADVDSRTAERFNIKLRDKLQRLNAPISEKKLGDFTANADRLVPLTFGECHNVTPLLVNPVTHEYQFHAGPVEGVIEVRDEGVPVAHTVDAAAGTFKLLQSNAGNITASVQGDKPGSYANTVAPIIQRLATAYGTAQNRFTNADIDATNFAEFSATATQPVGIYLDQRANVLQIIQELAASVGAQPVMSREGKLRLLRLELPGYGPPVVLTPSSMVASSFRMAERIEVLAGVQIAYCKNWTVQAQLQTAIPPEHKDLFAQEWLTKTVKDPNVASNYRMFSEPVQQTTYLLVAQDAQAEAVRRLNFRKQTRQVYEFEGFEECFMLNLGQAVMIKHYRFGMTQGVPAIVKSLALDHLNARVTVQVLI